MLYADDIEIFKKIVQFDGVKMVQSDICNIMSWASINELSLNPSNCQFMSFLRKNKEDTKYKVGYNDLVPQEAITDLGVLFDSQLSFSQHYDSLVNKGFRTLGFVTRACSNFTDTKTFFLLFDTYVRSKLEYAL